MIAIIGHRGASAYAPENTLAAFQQAFEQGATMIELDVRRCADGTLIVFHDDTTMRWNDQPYRIEDCSWPFLQTLDLQGERIATLDEACTFSREHGMPLNIEIKQVGIADQVVGMVQSHAIAEMIILSSFHESEMEYLSCCAPMIRRGALVGHKGLRPGLRGLWPFPYLRAINATAWHPSAHLPLLQLLIPQVRQAGYDVYVWTVDDPTVMRQFAMWGASGIMTNKPDVACAALWSRCSSLA